VCSHTSTSVYRFMAFIGEPLGGEGCAQGFGGETGGKETIGETQT
jgi:hypothetical protein